MVTKWLLRGLLVLTPLIALAEPGEQDAVLAVTRLDFTASDESSEPYPMQVYVYDGGLRIESGSGDEGYVYFDRAARQIYKIADQTQTATIYPAGSPPNEEALRAYLTGLEVESMAPDQQALPRVGDYETDALTLTANGVPCATAILAPELLKEVSNVLSEYLRVLAITSRQAITQRDRDEIEDCELAVDIVKPDWPLQAGFPVVLENFRGERRFLENYTADVPASPELFGVPEGYAIVEAAVSSVEEAAEPETAEPETAEPETAEPETAEPETAEPEAAEPEAAEPEAAEPEAAESGYSESGSVEAPQDGIVPSEPNGSPGHQNESEIPTDLSVTGSSEAESPDREAGRDLLLPAEQDPAQSDSPGQ